MHYLQVTPRTPNWPEQRISISRPPNVFHLDDKARFKYIESQASQETFKLVKD